MRIDLGLLLGVGILTGGVYFFPERRQYRQILMGGGIVVLFGTGLAASSLYSLISANLALLFFIAVADAAFAIAERQFELRREDAALRPLIYICGPAQYRISEATLETRDGDTRKHRAIATHRQPAETRPAMS